MVQGLSGGAGVLLETICLDAKAAASATMAIDWGVQGAAQTQAPSSLHVLAISLCGLELCSPDWAACPKRWNKGMCLLSSHTAV